MFRTVLSAVVAGAALAGVAALPEESRPSVVNGDFQLGHPGELVGWSVDPEDRQVWSLVSGAGLNGNRGLEWKSTVAVSANSFRQDVSFTVGKRYLVEGYVKTDLRFLGQKRGSAGLRLEWFDANGKRLGSCYPRKVRDTSDWTKVEGETEPLPLGTARLTVSPFVIKGSVGTVQFDEIDVREFVIKPLGALSSSVYRDEAVDGDVTFFVPLFLPTNKIDVAACRIVFEMVAADGSRRLRPAADVTPDMARITCPVDDLAFGTNAVVCTLTSQDGLLTDRAVLPFARLEALPPRRVRIDARNRFIVDGRPFFPLGVSSQGYTMAQPEILARLKECPINHIIVPNVRFTREELDIFEANGIKVIYALKDVFANSRRAPKDLRTEADEIPWLERFLAEFRTHPAILAWSVTDEPAIAEVPRLAKRRAWLAAHDPDHPTYGVYNHIAKMRHYLPTADVIGSDIYPVPERPLRAAADGTIETARSVCHARCVFQTMQAFAWGDIKYLGRSGRFPTKHELRAMAWQMIAGGANALHAFAFNMMVDTKTGKPRNTGWADFCDVMREIAPLTPILLAGDEPPPVTGVTDDFIVRTFREGCDVWALVCNLTECPLVTSFVVADVNGAVEGIVGTGVTGADGRLAVQLAPWDVALVKVGRR